MRMAKKVLIVEDEFIEANDLQLMLTKAGYNVCGIARSVPVAQKLVEQERPDLVLLDIFLKGKLTGVDLAHELKKSNTAFIFLSANSNEEILATAKTTEPYGFIVKPYREKDLLVTLEIAQYRHEHSIETQANRASVLQSQLEEIAAVNEDGTQKLLKMASLLQQHIPFDFMAAGFNNTGKISFNGCGFLRLGFNEYQTIGTKELLTITGMTEDELAKLSAATEKDLAPAFFNDALFEQITQAPSLKKMFSRAFQLRSNVSLPVHLPGGEVFNLNLYSRSEEMYHSSHTDLFERLKPALVRIAEAVLFSGSKGLSGQASPAKIAGTPVHATGFESIIGRSHLLLNVFDNITQVAPHDTSVLILGESGTGKERIADSIHNLSSRRGKPFVKLNCATLPAALIESELFGHEKGAFTGAADKRIGKFEQAHGGTIFLDEIGEMPVDLQVKLLRVLQEKEIEPIGSRATVKIDVRIIAATSRNLEKEVADGRFRLDLYYRLNVFPILLPPLRERLEDIPELVQHFIQLYNRKAGKSIGGISAAALGRLGEYSWPGNIRELEHLIERSVLLAKGNVIEDVPLPKEAADTTHSPAKDMRIKTIFENERDHILGVLKRANGKIWGTGGAAELLDVPPTTLVSKMKKLGIKKMFFQ